MKSYNDASSEAFLPGLSPSDGGAGSPGHQSDTISRTGWWVRRTDRQKLDAAGQPAGYRHQLMHGRKVISTGVGADFARTIQQQADFQNAKDQVPNDKS
jgi:hypothetical protein